MKENNAECKDKNDELYKEIGEKIYPLFFSRNFGLATKSEIESMLFSIYLKHKKEGERSDRILSRELGISETKVKNLKRTCYARYDDEIKFPDLLISLSKRESNLMYFKIYKNNNSDLLCRITVSEIVYLDELRTQLNNSGIQFIKSPGTNYLELPMKEAISFFNQENLTDKNEDLVNLVNDMKKIDFDKNFKTQVVELLENSSLKSAYHTVNAIMSLTRDKGNTKV